MAVYWPWCSSWIPLPSAFRSIAAAGKWIPWGANCNSEPAEHISTAPTFVGETCTMGGDGLHPGPTPRIHQDQVQGHKHWVGVSTARKQNLKKEGTEIGEKSFWLPKPALHTTINLFRCSPMGSEARSKVYFFWGKSEVQTKYLSPKSPWEVTDPGRRSSTFP